MGIACIAEGTKWILGRWMDEPSGYQFSRRTHSSSQDADWLVDSSQETNASLEARQDCRLTWFHESCYLARLNRGCLPQIIIQLIYILQCRTARLPWCFCVTNMPSATYYWKTEKCQWAKLGLTFRWAGKGAVVGWGNLMVILFSGPKRKTHKETCGHSVQQNFYFPSCVLMQ